MPRIFNVPTVSPIARCMILAYGGDAIVRSGRTSFYDIEKSVRCSEKCARKLT